MSFVALFYSLRVAVTLPATPSFVVVADPFAFIGTLGTAPAAVFDVPSVVIA